MNKNRLSAMMQIAAMIAGIALIIATYVWAFRMARKTEQADIDRNKQCYQELTVIVRQSSPGKAKWIENTVIGEKNALRSVNYCRVLKLVKEDSQEGFRTLNGRQATEDTTNHEK